MSAIDVIRECAESWEPERKETVVSEWKNMRIFAGRLTIANLDTIERYSKKRGTDVARYAKTMQIMLEDEQGEKIFAGPKNLQFLETSFDAEFYTTILKNLGIDDESMEEVAAEAEKKLEAVS